MEFILNLILFGISESAFQWYKYRFTNKNLGNLTRADQKSFNILNFYVWVLASFVSYFLSFGGKYWFILRIFNYIRLIIATQTKDYRVYVIFLSVIIYSLTNLYFSSIIFEITFLSNLVLDFLGKTNSTLFLKTILPKYKSITNKLKELNKIIHLTYLTLIINIFSKVIIPFICIIIFIKNYNVLLILFNLVAMTIFMVDDFMIYLKVERIRFKRKV